jgi:hypothetical protein
MKKHISVLVFIFLFFSGSILAQDGARKPLQFEIALSPFSAAQSEQLELAIVLGLTGDISNRFQWGVDFYAKRRTRTLNVGDGVIEVHSEPQGQRTYDINTSFSLSGRYYFAKDKFAGHYAMFRVHNVWAKSYQATDGQGGSTDRRFLPMHGIYYGYRVEAKSLFFDVAAGVIPHQLQINQVRPNRQAVVAMRMTMGFIIPFTVK